MAEVTSLDGAVAELIADGSTIAMEGFNHLIPMAVGHEIIRQQRRQLTLIRMTPDIIYDQMIGMGCARRLRPPRGEGTDHRGARYMMRRRGGSLCERGPKLPR